MPDYFRGGISFVLRHELPGLEVGESIDGLPLDDITIFTSELEDVSDDYVFQSGDGDALYLHGFVLTLYL